MKTSSHFQKFRKKTSLFFRLSFEEERYLVQAGFFLIFLRFGLSVLPLTKFYNLLNFFYRIFKPYIHEKVTKNNSVELISWSINVMGNYVLAKKCLAQALAGKILLALKGVDTQLNIGFIKYRKQYSAHAWLMLENQVIIGQANNLELYIVIPINKFNEINKCYNSQ